MILRLFVIVNATMAAYLLLAGEPRGLPTLARVGVALCVLAPSLALWLRPGTGEAPTARDRQRPDWLDRLTLAAVAAVAAIGFAWLLCVVPQPMENLAFTLEETLRPEKAAARQQQMRTRTESRAGNWLWDSQTHRPLPRRTNLVPGTRPEAFVVLRDPADAADLLRGGAYLRSFALGNYQNAYWTIQPQPPSPLQPDATGFIQFGTPARRLIVHEVFHARHQGGQNVFTALQGAVAAQVPELTRVDEDLLLLPPPRQGAGYQYVVSSSPLSLSDLPEIPNIEPMANTPAALTAPPVQADFARRLRERALAAAGAGTNQQRLNNIRKYLHANYTYSLQTTNQRELDPLDNFLFEEKRGHCELFATAAALMARAIGVPARIAYGWNGGTYYENNQMFVFRAKEAHAWTEVCLAGHGWVMFDATPSGAMRRIEPEVAPPDEVPPLPDAPAPDEADATTTAADGADIRLPLACLALALGLLVWRGTLRRRERDGAADIPGGVRAPLHYYAAWRRAAARRGRPMPPGATLRAHLANIGDSVPFGQELLAYHYAVCYGGHPRAPRTERKLRSAIRQWEAAKPGA